MTPEQLEMVIGAVSEVYVKHGNDKWLPIIADMRAALAAMRTATTAPRSLICTSGKRPTSSAARSEDMSEQLTANELEILIDLASAGERYTPEQYAVIKSAERVLAAMRKEAK